MLTYNQLCLNNHLHQIHLYKNRTMRVLAFLLYCLLLRQVDLQLHLQLRLVVQLAKI